MKISIRHLRARVVLVLMVLCAYPLPSKAQNSDSIFPFLTPEERRESGGRLELSPWLALTALAELETNNAWNHSYGDARDDHASDQFFVFQGGLELNPLSWAKFEFLYEYDGEEKEHLIDEFFVELEASEQLSLKLGRLFVPFGEYYSHFISGPILEFGEIRGDGAVLTLEANEFLDLSFFLYEGPAEKVDSHADVALDWGFAAELRPSEPFILGVSFVSDLADSDENLFADSESRYLRKVSAISSFLSFQGGLFDCSLEFIQALKTFREFDPPRNRPSAWNLEFAYRLTTSLESAVRFESSSDVVESPKFRFGVGITWRVSPYLSLGVEYLRGQFRRGEQEDSIRSSDELLAQAVLTGF